MISPYSLLTSNYYFHLLIYVCLRPLIQPCHRKRLLAVLRFVFYFYLWRICFLLLRLMMVFLKELVNSIACKLICVFFFSLSILLHCHLVAELSEYTIIFFEQLPSSLAKLGKYIARIEWAYHQRKLLFPLMFKLGSTGTVRIKYK